MPGSTIARIAPTMKVTVLSMGISKPWPEALMALTGEDRMNATAIVDYFQPLLDWLKEQNKGATCGW